MSKDTVYALPQDKVPGFRFDARVADVFENMINRSVPGYGLILDLIGLVTETRAIAGTNAYDLGCSLGASTLMIRRHLPAGCHVIGIDNSSAMVERCRANVARDHSEASIEIREQDLQETTFENASIAVMNFTLQFVEPAERAAILGKIARGMHEGGALVLAEKVCIDDPKEQRFITDLHHEFKRQQGYSDLEIAQKRAALENVLVPETVAQHSERLTSCGFSEVHLISSTLNFACLLAIR